MSSTSGNDRGAAGRAMPSGGAPERTTSPGVGERERTTLPGLGEEPDSDPHTIEVSVDDLTIERISLVELPVIMRYGRFELVGRIAYGGMAEIFLAREQAGAQGSHRMLVIKRVLPHVAQDEHFVEMFVDEARLAMLLNHPNICHVYAFGEEEQTYYIAMEWVNGKPLSKLIRRARELGGLPVPVVLKIIGQVAEALDYAHRACDAAGEPLGIVHRDISPQNIMVSYDGVVKLLDFGIAKAASHSTRTEAGVIKGKFAYMSPQQCVGEPIDGRADIFALGVCLFEALTGKNPFRRKTEFDTMMRIVGEATPSARERRPELPEDVEQIIETALMKQPERRFQTAGEMQLAIESVLAKHGMMMNAARVGEYVSRIFADDVREGPELDRRLGGPPRPKARPGSDDSLEQSPVRIRFGGSTELDATAFPAYAPRPASKRSNVGILVAFVVALLLVMMIGGGLLAWVLFGGTPERVAVREPPPPVVRSSAPRIVPAAVEPVRSGSVFIDSVPRGASIRFGDRDGAGTTPLEMGTVEPGTYDVRLALLGHADWTGQIEVIAGQRAQIRAQLVSTARAQAPAAPPGELSLNTQPWSKVYLGRRLLGTTPIGHVRVPSGTQRLRLVDRDGTAHQRTVRVPPGGHVVESYDLRE